MYFLIWRRVGIQVRMGQVWIVGPRNGPVVGGATTPIIPSPWGGRDVREVLETRETRETREIHRLLMELRALKKKAENRDAHQIAKRRQ